MLIGIAHSLFLYRYLIHGKAAPSYCKKQYEIGKKSADFM
jgi:hypothetical protein